MAQTIGQVAKLMVSSSQSVKLPNMPSERVTELAKMEPGDLTAADCQELKDWATSQPIRHEPATLEQFTKLIDFLATMPSRSDDIDTGRLRFTIYRRMLGDYSNDALQFMVFHAFERHTFFPSVKDCLEILREYQPPPLPRDNVLRLCQISASIRLDAWLARIEDGTATQSEIDAAPEAWKRIADCRLLLWIKDGEYVRRPARKMEDA